MEYVIDIFKRTLRDELEAKANADCYINGELGIETKYSKMTMDAFKESRKLAIERIPQLEKALEFIGRGEEYKSEIIKRIKDKCTDLDKAKNYSRYRAFQEALVIIEETNF